VRPSKQALLELIALLEAGIDFAEDDVDVAPQAEIGRRIDELRPPLAVLEASFARGRIVHDGLTLAIVGRPNAGKSSLFNRLVERDRAIVTATPGTTRDTITERISLDGIPLELVDTAGLRADPGGNLGEGLGEGRGDGTRENPCEGLSKGLEEAEQLGIRRSREALADAALVVVVLDATQPLNDEERRLLEAVAGRPAIAVINKSDLLQAHKSNLAQGCQSDGAQENRSGGNFDGREVRGNGSPVEEDSRESAKNARAADLFAGIPTLLTSALTGEGIAALRERILALATGGAAAEPGILTSLRHRQAIATALSALDDATQANASSIPHEMILLDLYRAMWALDSLTGQTTPDEILNLIFSSFCIGK
jgi:tRNA modification GTPase